MNLRKTTATMLLAAAMTSAFVACDKGAKYSPDEIRFSYRMVEKSYRLPGSAADYDQEHDLSIGCRAQFILPEVLRGKDAATLRDSVLSAAFGSCQGSTDSLVAGCMRRFAEGLRYQAVDTIIPDSVVADNPNFLSRYDGCYSATADIETMTGRLVVYAVTVSSYIPHAAHGMYRTTYVNYDIDSARVVTLGRIFSPEGIEALPGILRDIAASMASNIGRTDIEALPQGDNFYITAGNDIVFAYQPYEVASYAQGEIRIPVPAYLLANYLTDYGTALLLQ